MAPMTRYSSYSLRKTTKIEIKVEETIDASVLTPILPSFSTPTTSFLPKLEKKPPVRSRNKVKSLKTLPTPLNSPQRSNPPSQWSQVYDILREYRATHHAPVDDMGCEIPSEIGEESRVREGRDLIPLSSSAPVSIGWKAIN